MQRLCLLEAALQPQQPRQITDALQRIVVEAAILRLTSHESPPVERLSLHIPALLLQEVGKMGDAGHRHIVHLA